MIEIRLEKNRYKVYYKGQWLTLNELVALPECHVKIDAVRRRLLDTRGFKTFEEVFKAPENGGKKHKRKSLEDEAHESDFNQFLWIMKNFNGKVKESK